MEEALIARLVAAGTLAEDRWSWFGRARGDGLPAGVLMKVSPGEDWTHDGPDGLDRPRVRFDLYAESDTEAVALAREVKSEMQQSCLVAGVQFHPAMLDAARTLDASEGEGGEPLFRVQQEYLLFYEETD